MKSALGPLIFFQTDGWKTEDLTLATMRVTTGIFLIYGVLDNVLDAKRMQEFARFMKTSGFVAPEFWAPFSVYTQLLAGLMLVAGLGVRLAGAIVATTFVVGLYMVHWSQSLREWWPALALVIIGVHFVARGAGGLSLDALLFRRFGSQRK